MLVWRKILAHGLKRLATPALHLWRIRHGLVEELALCIKSLATPDLISETYSWFSHSATRQIAYKQIYQTINDSKVPLKIVNTSDTRWLSIEPAISRILNQWLELKTDFEVARLTDKCYKAEVLYNMYRDEKHLLYLLALHPVLVQVQKVNKVFESNDADKTKLLDDLTRLMRACTINNATNFKN